MENDPRSKGIQLLSFITIDVASDDTDTPEQEVTEEKLEDWREKDDYQRRLQDETITLTTFGLPTEMIEDSQASETTVHNKQPGIPDDVKYNADPQDENTGRRYMEKAGQQRTEVSDGNPTEQVLQVPGYMRAAVQYLL